MATEFLNSPEVALRLLAGTDPTPTTSCKTIDVEYVHDMRGEQLWKFGALIYDLLHGYAPWEVPTLDPKVGALRDIHDLEATDDIRSYIRSRRHRMFIDDLAIDNRLSQDCTDVLRILLARKLEDRPKLEQIAAFPWFQGHWVDYPLETFRRPPFKRAPPPKHGEIRYFEQRS